MSLTWSKPYLGIQHASGHPLLDRRPREYQVTVEDHNANFAEWWIIRIGSFTPIHEGTCLSAWAAREAAEKQFVLITGSKP